MKRRILFFLFLSVISAVFFTGCKDDNKDSYVQYYVTLGNLYTGTATPQIILDDKTILYIETPEFEDKNIEGQRVLAGYKILADKIENGSKNFIVNLLNYEDVEVKRPVYSSLAGNIGEDFVNIERTGFGGRYLNIEYRIGITPDGPAHTVALVVNEDNPDADEDNVYVIFTHDAKGDKENIFVNKHISFDITSLIPEGKTSVTIHLTHTDYLGRVITEKGIFTYDEDGL
ncbi:MAG: hypothetical protein LIO79_09475 [Rikenellaceae bacterium]|nr:hypothetical protein [Rikenellaceae bacterium]